MMTLKKRLSSWASVSSLAKLEKSGYDAAKMTLRRSNVGILTTFIDHLEAATSGFSQPIF
jgi:hypothetical protein